MTTSSFGYNGLDARVSKTDSAGTFSFKRNGAGVTDPVLSDGAATYTPGISERRGGNSKYLHSGMKNADAQSGASANVDSSRTYDAFGNLTGSSGSWSGPFGYAGGFGYQEDPDHGLRLLGHRYYDSSTGRFISKDPIGDGRNWTAYCGNNPLARIDAAGLSPDWLNWKNGLALAGGIAGAALGGPLGAAIGSGLGRALGGLIEGESVGQAVLNGIIDGAITYVGGKLLVGVGKALQKAGGSVLGRFVSVATKRGLLQNVLLPYKQGLTEAGRALAKKIGNGSAIWGQKSGGVASYNDRAEAFLRGLLNDPASRWNRVYSPTRGKYLVEVVDPVTGRGAVWEESGVFVGFRNPNGAIGQ